MPNYPGRRKGTRRIVIWSEGRPHEWIVEGTKTDGDAFEARERLKLGSGKLSNRTAPTFSDFSEHQYKPHAETHLKETSWNVRTYQLATLIEFFGSMRLTEITTLEVESYKRVRLRAGLKPTSLNNELRFLRTVLNYARALSYPTAEQKFTELAERGRGRVRFWTVAELERLFAAARSRDPELMRMLVFLANTGCRKGEALACEWDWIDFDSSMIRIPSNDAWQPKNGRPREVPMSDAVRAVLSAPAANPRWVFPTQRGRRRYQHFPTRAFNDARRDAGLSGGPHTLRHTFASHFLQRVPDLFLLSKVLGHSHGRVTELYAHLLPDHLARARNAVNVGPQLSEAAPNHGRRHGGKRKP